jgi:prepilin-type processing-associated H-X9-DG protein
MNAGMFNDAGAPIGLYVSEGAEQRPIRLNEGPGNFHLLPNGVFWQGRDGAVHVDTSDDYAVALREPRWATQSGPMLVIDGALHPRIADDGVSRYVRNGVGVPNPGTALFVISSGAVSFGRFARFFRDRLRCRNALFFDGSVSSLWAPALERRDSGHRIGPMVVVLRR